jgi:thiamine-phosphate pyrophosphorylase
LLPLPSPLLCLITDDAMDLQDVEARVADACDAGARLVQLRNRFLDQAALRAHAERLRAITAERGALLAINARSNVAPDLQADAFHLPADGEAMGEAKARFGKDSGIGRSIHSIAEIDGFESQCPDYVHFGPIYPTASKARYGPPQGLEGLREVVRRIARLARRPKLVAVGGIDKDNVAETIDGGADGIAVIGAVMSAPDAGEATYALLAALRNASDNS